ncbi:MAG: DUF2062 domain-containing protein [Rhizobiaceae bacterium]|nr:DUF2062 domain-containing protein [Rhizobiaceae bacterium]
MLLKRRKPPTWTESFRVWIWPRRSWMRSGQYVTKRILRLTATPHAVAAGVAAGAFTSFSPFMGLHFLIAFVLAWMIRGNLLASALGTFVGNPLTFPFIWAATYNTGQYLLHNADASSAPPDIVLAMTNVMNAVFEFDGHGASQALNQIWEPLLLPMLVGGGLIGLIVTVPLYFVTRRAAAMFRESRKNKLIVKAAEIKARATQMRKSIDLAGGAKQT